MLFIISYAIETCIWNKLAILYLLIQLGEKDLFSTMEITETLIYMVSTVNIIMCVFLINKGIRILKSK